MGTTSGTKLGHYAFATKVETYRQAEKKPSHHAKQVIIFHLVTKYFADGVVITCGETKQTFFLTVDGTNPSPPHGWELHFSKTHHPPWPHL